MAHQWLSQNWDQNRRLRKHKVEVYASAMKRGQWKLDGASIVFSEEGKLIDGQHRLAAIIESATPITTVVVRGVSTDAYVTMDTGMARNPRDVLPASAQNATTAAAGIKLVVCLEADMQPTAMALQLVTREDILVYYSDHESRVNAASKRAKALQYMHTNPSAWTAFELLIPAEIFETYLMFYAGVYTGVGLAAGDPRLALRNWLTSSHRFKLDRTEYLATFIRTFNSFTADRTIRKLGPWRLGQGPFPKVAVRA